MNRLFIFLLLLIPGLAPAQSLTIINQDYEEAKKVAKAANKLILIDFYTTWCGPCKQIDREIFQDKAVADEIAKNFIVLKYDAERDSVHQLSLKHHVMSYPTTMILNRDQRVVSRLYGLGGSDEDLVKNYKAFLNTGLEANQKGEYIKGISANTKQDYPQFYREYVYRTNTKNTDAKVAAYWATKPDYLGEVPFAVLCYFMGGTPEVNEFFLANKKKYEELYGKRDVQVVVSMIIAGKFDAAIKAKDRAAFDAAVRLAKENIAPEELSDYPTEMEVRMLQSEDRWPEAIALLETRRNNKTVSPMSVAYFCWTAYQKCKDMEVLKKCTEWLAEISVQKPNINTLSTYARLLHKTGNTPLAITKMKEAIKVGKENEEDVSDCEKWIETVK